MRSLAELLEATAALHHHLCPRQVLGVRIGLLGGEVLGLDLSRRDKRLLAIVETAGCAVDGIAVATGCSVGRRTLRIEDYGKVAATFVDGETERAVRIVPRQGCRQAALAYAPAAGNHWKAQLLGYQRMPAQELLTVQSVRLRQPLEAIVSRPGTRVTCQTCGEEVINDRQVVHEGSVLCRACLRGAYYSVVGEGVLEGVGS